MLLLSILLGSGWILQVSFGAAPDKIWSTCNNTLCGCGYELHGAILCSEDSLQIQPCYCMFYDEDLKLTIAGNCMFGCYPLSPAARINRYSIKNASFLNQDMCHTPVVRFDTHREGRFCGRCAEGYGLAVYSYHYISCIPCTDYGYKNWLKYFAVALLPLTLFYFLVVLLQIDVTSSRLNGVVFVVQSSLSPVQLRLMDSWTFRDSPTGSVTYVIFLKLYFSVVGIFNLDFFRFAYPTFCLHPRFNILHVTSLDFIVALYPFVLIFLTYLLVAMYDRNCRLVVLAWKPFKWCLRRYQRQFNVRASLVHTFATFFLLSNVKILVLCFDLLALTRAYDSAGNHLGRQFLYYDATIEYFSPEHLPFAVLALIIGFVFVFLPFLLLMVYPCGCFQRCLSRLGLGCPALHIFMDAFQGSYRTEPHDLRYFSAYYLFLRFTVLLLLVTIKSVFVVPAIALVIISGIIIFATFQPYKNDSHNKLDIVSLLTMALVYVGYSSGIIINSLDRQWFEVKLVIFAVPFMLFSSVAIGSVAWVFFRKLYNVFRSMLRCLRTQDNTSHSIETFEREGPHSPSDQHTPLLRS